ncbi:MAG: hypothetical protein WDZ89_01695 [Gemmatimonadota bacterium]
MNGSRTPLALYPPFAVGAVLAVAAELAAGLLLYSGLGFLEALSVILAIETGSLGLGLWIAASVPRDRFVDVLRRQWLFLLFAFTAAAFFAAGWEILGGSAEPRSQALGMALLAGLPLFAGGVVLGLLLREDAGLLPPEDSLFPGPGPLVAFGAGAGFLATGFLILRNVPPTSILLVCVILVSAGALIHGRILARRSRAKHAAALAVLADDFDGASPPADVRSPRSPGGVEEDSPPAAPGEGEFPP